MHPLRRAAPSPVIKISSGTFFRHPPGRPAGSNPPLFPGLKFELPSEAGEHWCIVGPSLSGKTTLLHALQGRLLCDPPTARSFPYLATDAVPHRLRDPRHAIQYVGFDGESGGTRAGVTTSPYLSARYESRREATDFSLADFLRGNTQLNPLLHAEERAVSEALLDRVVDDLRLGPLLALPVAFLSNGQGRRARIARALLTTPQVLLLDEPFMGLDPHTVRGLDPLLGSLAERRCPRLVLSARPQDPIPDWITHVVHLNAGCEVGSIGPRDVVLRELERHIRHVEAGPTREAETMRLDSLRHVCKTLGATGRPRPGLDADTTKPTPTPKSVMHGTDSAGAESEPLVQMDGCVVRYGSKTVLGNWTQETDWGTKTGLVWTVRRGDRWGVFGPNGSGKTTLVSLLCSDHPQAYSLPMKLFGRDRLPEPGSEARRRPLTFWDIQARVGHSSPEVHQHMPRSLTVRQVLESAWAATFRARPELTQEGRAKVNAALDLFRPQLDPNFRPGHLTPHPDQGEEEASWPDQHAFGRLSFSAQRVALLIRAVIKSPDIVVLDEAFSGMDDEVREKCMSFLVFGDPGNIPALSERQALVCISHIKEECPDCLMEWMCLPEGNSGLPARFGRLDGPMREGDRRWEEVWESASRPEGQAK